VKCKNSLGGHTLNKILSFSIDMNIQQARKILIKILNPYRKIFRKPQGIIFLTDPILNIHYSTKRTTTSLLNSWIWQTTNRHIFQC